jgi:hypothetical protein
LHVKIILTLLETSSQKIFSSFERKRKSNEGLYMLLCKGVLNHASWAKRKCVATLSCIVHFLKYVQSGDGDGFGFSDVVVSFVLNVSPPMKSCTSPPTKMGA